MGRETKQCQNCKQNFVIEPEDFDFYKKINVPPPTWCPECRMIRRFNWRNEMSLYRRECGATGKSIVTMFAPETPVVVYERNYWWSDAWDQLTSGREYDFSKPFFVQFRDLLEKVPLPNLANSNCIDSEYGNHNADLKNCYLVYASFGGENTHYSSGFANCKNSLDLYQVDSAEISYDSVLCNRINRVLFSQNTSDSMGSYFLKCCVNVNDSFGCVNLRNKSHCFFNKQLTKEEYEREMEKIDLGSFRQLSEMRERFTEFSRRFPRRFASVIKCVDVTGDNVLSSKNCKACFDAYKNVENSKYTTHAIDLKDSYDGYGMGGNAELLYEVIDCGIDAANYKCAGFVHKCHDVQYVYACYSSSHLFGCVGLRNKQYCILNKQCSKEEYEALVPRIIAHMNAMPYVDKQGRTYKYGEFFPPELSPFAYNETIAQEYFPLTREEALKQGYRWRDPGAKEYQITKKPEDLPDHIGDVNDGILNEIIGCAHEGRCTHQCTTAFKIIKEELAFYRKMHLPLPRLCPNCRHYERFALRNPLKLWHRQCMCGGQKSEQGVYQNTASHPHGAGRCPAEFETPYAPDRKEIIYCESCYNAEIV